MNMRVSTHNLASTDLSAVAVRGLTVLRFSPEDLTVHGHRVPSQVDLFTCSLHIRCDDLFVPDQDSQNLGFSRAVE